MSPQTKIRLPSVEASPGDSQSPVGEEESNLAGEQLGAIAAPCFCAFSVLHLGEGDRVKGGVHFSERKFNDHLPEGTAGYVRCDARRHLAKWKQPVDDPLPWRDYDGDRVLLPISDLIEQLKKDNSPGNYVIISARNSINEWGYQLRFQGRWYRRRERNKGQEQIQALWPVILVSEAGVRLLPLVEAEAEANLVTGIPLVINGKPAGRSFLIANCSDVSHVYEVDPQGRGGTSAAAWVELSESWQLARDEGASEEVIAQRMDEIAREFGVPDSCNKLHSVMAERDDGSLMALAVTGALVDIAQELVLNWQVRHAVLLDNGGSVGWRTLLPSDWKRGSEGSLLVAGPNYRPRGLAFISLRVGGFVQPCRHPALLRKRGGE